MGEYKGLKAFPQFNHFLEPMYEPLETGVHVCRYCQPGFFARLAPGFGTCIRCGVVIHGVPEETEEIENDDVCERCWKDIVSEDSLPL